MSIIPYIDSYLKANYIVIKTKLKIRQFAIVEFVNEQSVEVVPCNWITVNNISEQFSCYWPGSKNVLKFALSQKNPLDSWDKHDCLPRKFFGL